MIRQLWSIQACLESYCCYASVCEAELCPQAKPKGSKLRHSGELSSYCHLSIIMSIAEDLLCVTIFRINSALESLVYY